ncbi:TPA: low temperature requirement protein A [Streptococcus suis]
MSAIIAKHVSNYELFYDLIFVLATSSLTGLLHGDHVGFKEILSFITANIIIMTLWSNETIYLNKYGERDFLDIFTIIPAMYLIGNLSLNFNNEFELTALPFNAFLTLSYVLIFLQYFLRGRKIGFNEDIKATMHMLIYYIATFAIATLLVSLNLWSFDERILWVYFIPMGISYLFQGKISHDPINFPHIVERCQLITIITFEETVIAIIKNYPFADLPIEGILLFLAMATLFIFYISQTYLNIDHHRKVDVTILLYAHLIIILGLNFFTVAMEMFPSSHGELATPLLIAGNLLFYGGILATSLYNQELYRVDTKTLIIYGLLLVVGNLAIYLSSHHHIILFIFLNLMTHAIILINARHHRLANQSMVGEGQ